MNEGTKMLKKRMKRVVRKCKRRRNNRRFFALLDRAKCKWFTYLDPRYVRVYW